MAQRPRVAVPLTEIEEEFRQQLRFLDASCAAFDAGDQEEFRRIALAVRVLVYDSRSSTSLVKHLGLTSEDFAAFSRPLDPRNLLTETTLASVRMGPDPRDIRYTPNLDSYPKVPRLLSREDWWSEPVFLSPASPNRFQLSRSHFILSVANQAGGAHVDAQVDEDYYNVARQNAAGWQAFVDEESWNMIDLEKVYVRHIGFEVSYTLGRAWAKVLGNRGCACGSGRKFRYCHGKGQQAAVNP